MQRCDQRTDLTWCGAVPVSTRFDDPYYALADGVGETRHVFLGGNDLPARFASGFRIAELGFGTGLNALVAWAAWQQCGQTGDLDFTSFEAHPLPAADLARAHAAFPELRDRSAQLCRHWTGTGGEVALPGLRLRVIVGDARRTLPEWTGRADAWFLDGFAPARNPALWSPELIAEVARHTRMGGSAATYSAAGHVRRSLATAGFTVTRAPGFGRKRHMTRAVLA